MEPYYAVCIQTESEGTYKKEDIEVNLKRSIELIDLAAISFKYVADVKLVTFPEFFLQWGFPMTKSVKDWIKISVSIPGEETEKLAEKAREHNIYIAGALIEHDPEWANHFFNCGFIINPSGKVILKYRKVNPFIPREPSTSPHDILDRYGKELFPVAKTPIGNMGIFICYDGMFPEVARNLALNGAEILIRPTHWFDPWATEPIDWWSLINRVRALENTAYVIAPSTATPLIKSPTHSRPGHSMIVDFEGRILTQAERGESLIGAAINLDSLRYRRRKCLFNMLPQLRTEAYDCYKKSMYSPNQWLEKSGEATQLAESIEKHIKKLYRNKNRK